MIGEGVPNEDVGVGIAIGEQVPNDDDGIGIAAELIGDGADAFAGYDNEMYDQFLGHEIFNAGPPSSPNIRVDSASSS